MKAVQQFTRVGPQTAIAVFGPTVLTLAGDDMGSFYLVRHAEPDWSANNGRGHSGHNNDWVPLTKDGSIQAAAVADKLADELRNAKFVLTSPFPRARQTAEPIASKLKVPLIVHDDLREWAPSSRYDWSTAAEVNAAVADCLSAGGEWSEGNPKLWEPYSQVRQRVLNVMSNNNPEGDVVVVTHGMVMQALTGKHPDLTEVVKLGELNNLMASNSHWSAELKSPRTFPPPPPLNFDSLNG